MQDGVAQRPPDPGTVPAAPPSPGPRRRPAERSDRASFGHASRGRSQGGRTYSTMRLAAGRSRGRERGQRLAASPPAPAAPSAPAAGSATAPVASGHGGEVAHLGEREQPVVVGVVVRPRRGTRTRPRPRAAGRSSEVGQPPQVQPLGQHRVQVAVERFLDELAVRAGGRSCAGCASAPAPSPSVLVTVRSSRHSGRPKSQPAAALRSSAASRVGVGLLRRHARSPTSTTTSRCRVGSAVDVGRDRAGTASGSSSSGA